MILRVASVLRWFVILSSAFWVVAAGMSGMWGTAVFFFLFGLFLFATRHKAQEWLRQFLSV